MTRLGAVRLVGLVVVAASLVGAAGAGVAAHEQARLQVTAEGVAFDGSQVSSGAGLEYTVRPLNGRDSTYFRRYLTGTERSAGWAAFHEAADRYPNGYCVSWVRIDRYDWGEWMDGPTCTTPEPAEAETEKPHDTAGGEPEAEPTRAPEKPKEPAAGERTRERGRPTPEPRPTPSAAEPTPEPIPSTPSPTPSPSPSASPSAEPSPGPSPSQSDPARSIIRSFAQPSPEADGAGGPPPIAGLTWMWVVVAGIAAAAGGGVMMMLRRPL